MAHKDGGQGLNTYKSKRLCIFGLDRSTGDATVREYFSQFGTVTNFQILKDKDSGRSRGFGFIDYDNTDSIDAVMAGNEDHQIDGSRLTVFPSTPENLPIQEAVQERSALAIGEGALAEDEKNPLALANEPLAKDVLDALVRKERYEAAIELKLEWIVAEARRAVHLLTTKPAEAQVAYDKVSDLLTKFLATSKEWGVRPWSGDRWNRLLVLAGKRKKLSSLASVLDAMSKSGVKGNEEMNQVLAQIVMPSMDHLDAAEVPSELRPDKALPGAELPEVAFIRTMGIETGDPASLFSAIVTNDVRQKPEAEWNKVGAKETAREGKQRRQGKGKGKGKGNFRLMPQRRPSFDEDSVKPARLFGLNFDTSAGGAMPPLTLVDVPGCKRPSIDSLQRAAKGKRRVAAAAGVWGGLDEGSDDVKTEASEWQENVMEYLSKPRKQPLKGVFQVVDCRDFAKVIQSEVPDFVAGRTWEEEQQMLKDAKIRDDLCLVSDDKAIQEAVLRARPKHYVIVVADASCISIKDMRAYSSRRMIHKIHCSLDILLKRIEILEGSLRKEAVLLAQKIASETGQPVPKISVVVADPEQFAGTSTSQLWKLLWSCAEDDSEAEAEPE
eukprot:TRINITY_DN26450_c0_g1_i1.p1 TRINITY_DN26450_c0_g1~~TRINITY_DN26450_c0_g1_i1.p1  ORF type:complete len:703 (-),score=173.63 TRINITY_DN26450_c0_g1_i1:33-1865(-)